MKKLIKRLIVLVLVVGIVASGVIVYLGYDEYREVTSIQSLESKISELRSDPDYVTLAEIPDMVEIAMIAVEDKRFYDRNTILDYRSIGRAMLENLKAMSLVEGGSNIPQQVSKNLYFDHSASLVRKVSEFFVTRDLLNLVSKQDVLEMYLNIAYYGDNHVGIQEAAMGYFSIDVSELTDAQSTLLVGIVQSPANYELSRYYDRAKVRQQTTLQRLVEQEVMTQEEAQRVYLEDVFGG